MTADQKPGELLPCPFCGSDRIFVEVLGTRCADCMTMGPSKDANGSSSHMNPKAAIAAWNRRAERNAGEAWVACEERMPSLDDVVLIYAPGTYGLEHAKYRAGQFCWVSFRDYNAMWDAKEVTHWRPIPPPPTTAARREE